MPSPRPLPTIPSKPEDSAQRRQRDIQVNEALRQRASITDSGYILLDSTLKLALQSPNGHWWALAVTNAGNLTTTDLGTGTP